MRKGTYPLPPCESNTKCLNFEGNNSSCCSDRGGVCARREETQAVTIVPWMR